MRVTTTRFGMAATSAKREGHAGGRGYTEDFDSLLTSGR